MIQGSAYPVVIEEQAYGGGGILRSGDKRSPLTVIRTRLEVANPDVAVGFGHLPGFVARIHLMAHSGSKIAHGRKQLIVPPRRIAETSFREVHEPSAWTVVFPIDQIRFELPEAGLAHWLGDHRQAKRAQLDLRSGSGVLDNTLLAFARAALPSLADSGRASQFFIDHLLTGVCSYLFEHFCVQAKKLPTGGLAPWQERRAKEFIEYRLGCDLTLEELAGHCGLSVAHFTRAFRQSVGRTPHKWLMQRRVDTALAMLVSTDKPLVQIACDCGFADQAHFTNIFKRLVGAPPGAFRRERNVSKQRIGINLPEMSEKEC